jgi:serine/threonine protein kinase
MHTRSHRKGKAQQTRSFRKTFGCNELVVCPSESIQTYKYFNKYDLSYLYKEQEISNGVNGITLLLTFKRKGFTSTAVMKIPQKEKSKEKDNLFHEFIAGAAINKISKTYPCFVRTYAAFKTGSGPMVNRIPMQRIDDIPTIEQTCRTAGKQAILIEYVRGVTLKSMLDKPDFQEHQLLYVLYQVYYALAHLGSDFTHNDLHTSNVMIYQPKEDMCVSFDYGDVKFDCNYVAKIIDYGRSYVKAISATVDKIKTDPVCSSSQCTRTMPGDTCGYRYYDKEGSAVFKKPNISQDLRLLSICASDKHAHRFWKGQPKVVFDSNYMTKEVTTSGLPNRIHTVHDALQVLTKMVHGRRSEPCSSYGTIRVYKDKPWTFDRRQTKKY